MKIFGNYGTKFIFVSTTELMKQLKKNLKFANSYLKTFNKTKIFNKNSNKVKQNPVPLNIIIGTTGTEITIFYKLEQKRIFKYGISL